MIIAQMVWNLAKPFKVQFKVHGAEGTLLRTPQISS